MTDYNKDYHRGDKRQNRKRRYQDDDDRDYRHQRARYEDPGTRLRKETLTIAESPLIRIEESVKSIAKSFVSHFDNEKMRTEYIGFLTQIVVEQPFKIPFVASIALYANLRNPEAGKSIVDEFAKRCQIHLERCSWRQFKLTLRFLACTSSMLSGPGMGSILIDLVNFAADLATDGGNSDLSEEICRIVLLTIPYIMSSAPRENNEELAESLMDKVAAVLPPTNSSFDENRFTAFSGENVPYASENMSHLLMHQLRNEKEFDWKFHILPRPWEQFATEFETAEKHDLPNVSMPTQLEGGALFPEMYFSVFQGQVVETVPASTDASLTILRDAITDTVNGLDFNRIATARFLIDLDCYYAADVFLKRATPFDKIKDLQNQNTTWKPEDIVVDAVFSLIFRLPQPEHKLVYYHSVLTEICKVAPQAVAPSLGRAIRFLYGNIECLDVEIRYRFMDWFAHHLSNFGFTWKWLEWAGDLELPSAHPKKAFIVEAIDKEIRLSFANRVRGTLPEAYDRLIPSEKEKDLPDFKYEVEDSPFSSAGKDMLNLVRQKASDAEIEEAWTKIVALAESLDLAEPTKYARDIFVTSICHVGAKSLSHVLSCIERCKDRLSSIGEESPGARRDIVASVMSYWRDQPGVGANVIDKLLNYSLLTPLSVVEWVLQDAGPEMLPRGHAWEMFSNTTRKVVERTRTFEAAKLAPEITDEQSAVLAAGYNAALEEQNTVFNKAMQSLLEYGNEKFEMMNEEEDKWLKWWAEMWLRAVTRQFGVTGKMVTS